MDTNRGRTRPARLLAAAGVAVLMLLVVAPAVLAEEPQRYNCPPGFVWIRMSGTACVQETVPTNGKIGYDGHALCIDPYVGIYETRGTTDGKGVPGNPANAYAYLLECVTAEEFAARQARAAQGSQLGDVGRLLADAGRNLPPVELVLLGVLGSGALVLAALPQIRRPGRSSGAPARPATPPPSSAAPPTTPGPADAGPASQPDPIELRRRIATLDEIDRRLAERIEWYRAEAAAGRLTPQDVVEWAGIVSDLVGMLPIPAVQLPAGLLSIAANLAGMVGEHYDTRDLDRGIREGLSDMARLRGIIAGEREGYVDQLVEAEKPHEPAIAPVDPALLPDETLRAERDRAHERAMRGHEREREAIDEWIRARERLSQQDQRIDWLRDHLPDLDLPPVVEDAQRTNTWTNLVAGLDSYVRTVQEGTASSAAAETRDAVMKILRGETPGNIAWAVDDAVDAGATARGVARAGTYANVVSGGTALVSMGTWFQERSVERRRVIVEQALEGLRYEGGRLEATIRRTQTHMNEAHAATERESARRSALSAEIDIRAARSGHLLWPK